MRREAQSPVPVGGRHAHHPHLRLRAGSCSFGCGDVAATGGTVSVEMTREPALAVCVSTQSHAEWLLCMCVLTHVGAASREVTQDIRASTKW